MGVISTSFMIVRPHGLFDDLFAAFFAEVREVHAVRTHISNESCFVERLCDAHRDGNGESQLACGFLLECGSCEWRCRCACHGFLHDLLHLEGSVSARFKEVRGTLLVGEARVQLRFRQCGVLGGGEKGGGHSIVRSGVERIDFSFSFHDESHCHALYASCGEARSHFAPEHRGEFETHESVEHAARLLRIDEMEVNVTRVFDGVLDGRFGDFVEHDTFSFLRVESQHLGEVPRDGFSFAVLIGCEPDGLCLFCLGAQFAHHVLFVGGNLILWFKSFQVHPEIFLFQVSDVSVAGHHFEVTSEELLNGLRFRGRLHDD